MMKFKKTMLLVFVLILVVGLTGCDNWQNGIDEVENATGPSWDMDLSIPLLPATTVNVGEELYDYLKDEGMIDKDQEDAEDISFRERFNLVDSVVGEDLEINNLDFSSFTDESIVNITDLPSFDPKKIGIESVDINIAIDLKDFEIDQSDNFSLNENSEATILDNNASSNEVLYEDIIEMELDKLPDGVSSIKFDKGYININLDPDNNVKIEYEVFLNKQKLTSTDGNNYFAGESINGEDEIMINYKILEDGEQENLTEEITVTAEIADLKMAEIHLENYEYSTDEFIDFSDEFESNFKPESLMFNTGDLVFDIHGLEDYEIDIDLDDLTTILNNNNKLSLANGALSVSPDIKMIIQKGVLQVENGEAILSLDPSLTDDTKLDYIILEKPYNLDDELNENIKTEMNLSEEVKSIMLSQGEIEIEGLSDLDLDENEINISMILPDGTERKFQNVNGIYEIDLKDEELKKDKDGNWNNIEIDISSEIKRLKMVEKIEVIANLKEDIDWEYIEISQGELIGDSLDEKINGEFDLAEAGLDELDEIMDFFSLTGDTINLLIDLNTSFNDVLYLKLSNLEIIPDQNEGEKIVIDEVFINSDENSELLDRDTRSELAELIMEQPDKLDFTAESIEAQYPDEALTITKEELNDEINVKTYGIFELALNFEIKPDEDGKDEFTYKTETFELDELDEDARDALRNNLKSVELVQEMVNQLDLVGKIQFFIGTKGIGDGTNEISEEDFFDKEDENYVYHSSLIDLREGDQKYLNEDSLREGFIDALTENSSLYVGFKIVIPIDEEEQGRRISFSRSDRIELKMWSNVTVKVNSQN